MAGLGWALLTPVEQAVFHELNLARTKPQKYAQHIADEASHINGRQLQKAGVPPILLKEGRAAYDEAIAALAAQPPLPPYREVPQGLVLAAKEHAADVGERGITGHTGSDGSKPADRMQRHGRWSGICLENISFGAADPRSIVISLLVDDGVQSRGHRRNILNPDAAVVGIAVGNHSTFGTMCVQTFATSYEDKQGHPTAPSALSPRPNTRTGQTPVRRDAHDGVHNAETRAASQGIGYMEVRNRVNDLLHQTLESPPWAVVGRARRATAGADTTPQRLFPGCRIVVRGLQRQPGFNNARGTIIEKDPEMGAWRVHLDGREQTNLVLPHNLEVLPGDLELQEMIQASTPPAERVGERVAAEEDAAPPTPDEVDRRVNDVLETVKKRREQHRDEQYLPPGSVVEARDVVHLPQLNGVQGHVESCDDDGVVAVEFPPPFGVVPLDRDQLFVLLVPSPRRNTLEEKMTRLEQLEREADQLRDRIRSSPLRTRARELAPGCFGGTPEDPMLPAPHPTPDPTDQRQQQQQHKSFQMQFPSEAPLAAFRPPSTFPSNDPRGEQSSPTLRPSTPVVDVPSTSKPPLYTSQPNQPLSASQPVPLPSASHPLSQPSVSQPVLPQPTSPSVNRPPSALSHHQSDLSHHSSPQPTSPSASKQHLSYQHQPDLSHHPSAPLSQPTSPSASKQHPSSYPNQISLSDLNHHPSAPHSQPTSPSVNRPPSALSQHHPSAQPTSALTHHQPHPSPPSTAPHTTAAHRSPTLSHPTKPGSTAQPPSTHAPHEDDDDLYRAHSFEQHVPAKLSAGSHPPQSHPSQGGNPGSPKETQPLKPIPSESDMPTPPTSPFGPSPGSTVHRPPSRHTTLLDAGVHQRPSPHQGGTVSPPVSLLSIAAPLPSALPAGDPSTLMQARAPPATPLSPRPTSGSGQDNRLQVREAVEQWEQRGKEAVPTLRQPSLRERHRPHQVALSESSASSEDVSDDGDVSPSPTFTGEICPLSQHLALLLPTVPDRLVVMLGDRHGDLNGVYEGTSEMVNGYPLWKQRDGSGLLYSARTGAWTVTDDYLHFPIGAGFASTQREHAGYMPHAMGKGMWMVLQAKDDWGLSPVANVLAEPCALLRNTSAHTVRAVLSVDVDRVRYDTFPASTRIAPLQGNGTSYQVVLTPGETVPFLNGFAMSSMVILTAESLEPAARQHRTRQRAPKKRGPRRGYSQLSPGAQHSWHQKWRELQLELEGIDEAEERHQQVLDRLRCEEAEATKSEAARWRSLNASRAAGEAHQPTPRVSQPSDPVAVARLKAALRSSVL